MSAILPNGRVTWLRLDPALAPVAEVNQVVAAAGVLAERGQRAVDRQRRKIAHLTRQVQRDVNRLMADQERASRTLGRRIVAGDSRLDTVISKKISESDVAFQEQKKRDLAGVKRLGRHLFWDHTVLASSLPLFSAYGRKGRLFDADNVALTLMPALWLVGDAVTGVLAGTQDGKTDGIPNTDWWSYLAAPANLLLGWLLFHGQQQERFASGFAGDFPPPRRRLGPLRGAFRVREYTYRQQIDLEEFVAPNHFPDFATFAPVPVVASLVAIDWVPTLAPDAAPQVRQVTVEVDRGNLFVTVIVEALEPDKAPPTLSPRSVVADLKVAWMVDTQKPHDRGGAVR